MGRIGRDVMLCLREPSMGPVFGIKGGGNGGGYAQVVPMEEINLHFNGDFHAVQAAHNLLAAALDASIYHGNPLGIDPVSVTWPRTLDVNDRELRYSVVGLGGKAHGVPRENQFVIVAASEIMAVLALATDLADLRTRIGRIVVASDGGRRAGDRGGPEGRRGDGAIMKDAIKPNLVQTLEGQPTLIHAGPFGNIAHANNSIIEDRIALKLADYVVTEAGFASDLGFQKFCDIVCRFGGFAPSAGVLVTTVRATKSHGGTPFDELAVEDVDALDRGIDNLAAHIGIVREYGLPCVVSINNFPTDTEKEIDAIRELAGGAGAETVVVNRAFTDGGAGAAELAEAVVEACERPSTFHLLTPEGTPLKQQIEAIATKIYGADGVDYQAAGREGHHTDGAARLRDDARLHGQDASVAQPRSDAAEPSDRVPPARPRRRPERRRGVRGRALRRYAAHAGPRPDAGVQERRPRSRRPHRGPVLAIRRPRSRRRSRRMLGEREEVPAGIAQPELPGAPLTDLGSPRGLVALDLLRRGRSRSPG